MSNNHHQQWRCEACKGKNVQIQAWVCVNTHVYVDDVDGISETGIWCEDCQDHVELEEIPPQLQLDFREDKKCP